MRISQAIKNDNQKFVLSAFGALVCIVGVLLFLPASHQFFINFAEKVLQRHLRDYSKWHLKLSICGVCFCSIGAIFLFINVFIGFRQFLSLFQKKEAIRCFENIALAASVSFSLATVFFHEPWRDELQVWLICKNLPLLKIFYEMRYEGHFILWYLFVFPFARLGFPLIFLNLISWSVNCFGLAFFFKKSPFSLPCKALVAFSSPFLYVLPVVSRCYVLIPPLLFLMADIFPKRNENPVAYGILLALLANTHIYIEGFVAAIGIEFLFSSIIFAWRKMSSDEKKQRTTALCIGIFGVAIAAAQVLPSVGAASYAPNSFANFAVLRNENFESAIAFFSRIGYASVQSVFFAFLILHFILQFIFSNRTAFFIFIVSAFFMLVFATAIYGAGNGREFIWIYILLFCSWISLEKMELQNNNENGAQFQKRHCAKTSKIFQLLLCVFLIPTIDFYRNIYDFRHVYDSTKEISEKIMNEIPSKSKIFILNNHTSASIAAYLASDDYEFFDYKNRQRIYFHSWKKISYENLSDIEFFEKIFDENGEFYFFRDFDAQENFDDFYELLSDFDFEILCRSDNRPDFCLFKICGRRNSLDTSPNIQ